MRPVRVRLSAAGFSPWVMIDRLQTDFSVGLGVLFSSGANLTCSVQHTFDDLHTANPCSITRSGTAATLKLVNHGLSVSDWIQVVSSGSTNLDGAYAVASVVDADNITYTVVNTGATADTGSAIVHIGRVLPHLTLAGITASADGDYTAPIQACRLIVTSYTGGFVDLNVLQGAGG